MSGLLYTLLGLAASTSLHCAVRREISPCTCRQEEFSTSVINPAQTAVAVATAVVNTGNNAGHHGHGERIEVVCERMDSFEQVAGALRGKFTAEQQITLRVSHSNLRDISRHDFKELRMSITRLELNHDHLGFVDGEVFAGLGRTQYLSLADNEVPSIPRHILSHLSLLRTLDLSRNRISRIDSDDFKYNPTLQHLSMAGNAISEMVPGSLPPLVKHLHVGRNHLQSLNRTLRDLNQLEWLLINANELTSLDGELPSSGHNLKMLYAVDNKLTHLPAEFRYLHRLETLFLQHNKIRSLDGTLQKARRLKFLELSYNDLQELTEADFVEAEMLEDLELGHNSLQSLGGSNGGNGDGSGGNSVLYPLRSLKCLNLTHNELREFSFASLRGLRELRLLDLSNNRIGQLHRGRTPSENLVEEEGEETAGGNIQDMRLQHNELRSLDGSLFLGMKELQRLNLSHNALGPTIGPRDLRGLDGLKVLDLSHNELTTLEDTSETWLPSLEELNASHNRLVTLSERDFRGFPVLCWADVSANRIRTLMPELVANTRCTVHGVPDVLRIYLQDNPVLCDPGLADLTVALEVNHAKVYGVVNNCPTTPAAPTEQTSPLPPLPPTLLLAAAAAASGGNVSFAATLE
ncbi:leucine-rich repeat-containing larval translucida [Osmia lignaria lignaria]|uniref:leucine-rich repeat-containing larval translucida n=1 Tax=Osmia lignaria lignaria TaxID=1437193 RepID=UPI0014790744|nr:insulin-like growth factor-binding protein complex acid labile subunit [Osmia lignaria]XP_034195982.1 insulin-like growth factor-binding protein complex acid labile subunit [Osmia lignaria]XP_034195983.1 insulin-like growth factor-binding protein complex acid labile subunit [Osmia lignaria]XP_034195984.1 insulin-like growth factor-binding protein complex acid labile subunit [Osmia lignaria]XP_034195986.1 insulin-like growth factor-binding protein complex acid labile subunit [Osmia lignaria]